MLKNETPLTPIYRLLLNCIEQSEGDDFNTICERIKEIKNHFMDFSIINKNDTDIELIEETLKLVELIASENKDGAKESWDRLRNGQDINEKCDNCYLCQDCRKYYWNELGETLFHIDNDEKKDGKYFPVRRIPTQLESFFDHTKSVSELYLEHALNYEKAGEDFLIVLKGMSSSTPSLLNCTFDTQTYDGGGFFVKCNGFGIAIDPGYHFIYNLHHYGLTVFDIDCVIITHEHIDHNNDMRILDDLRSSIFRDIKKMGKKPLIWLMDEVSYKVAKVYQKNDTGFLEKYNELYYVNPADDTIMNDEGKRELSNFFGKGIDIHFFVTKHIQSKSPNLTSVSNGFKRHTFGCRFCFIKESNSSQKCTLVYTSDTSYFKELVDELFGCDVLIANISGIYEDDIMKIKGKDRHLGYLGCYMLVKNMYERYGNSPRIVLLSEFWNGLMDIRFGVSKYLKEDLRKYGIEQDVIPAEEGFEISLWNAEIKCTQCGRMVKKYHIQKPNGYNEKIKILCNDCYY